MNIIIAILLMSIFLFLSVLHIYWAFGGKWGSEAVLPTKGDNDKVIMPGVIPTITVALGLLGFGLIVFLNVVELDFNTSYWFVIVDQYGLLIIASIFILRAIGEFNYLGFFKKHKQTKFAKNDTKYYSPLCLVIGMLSITLQVNLHFG